MSDMLIVLSGFLACSWFLRIFARRRATLNLQYYLTLLTWGVFLYETLRLQYPALTLPHPWRHYQHRAEMLLVAIYGWEAVRYVVTQIYGKLLLQSD